MSSRSDHYPITPLPWTSNAAGYTLSASVFCLNKTSTPQLSQLRTAGPSFTSYSKLIVVLLLCTFPWWAISSLQASELSRGSVKSCCCKDFCFLKRGWDRYHAMVTLLYVNRYICIYSWTKVYLYSNDVFTDGLSDLKQAIVCTHVVMGNPEGIGLPVAEYECDQVPPSINWA